MVELRPLLIIENRLPCPLSYTVCANAEILTSSASELSSAVGQVAAGKVELVLQVPVDKAVELAMRVGGYSWVSGWGVWVGAYVWGCVRKG